MVRQLVSVHTQANGDTIVTFTDGKTMTIPKGAKGDKGDVGAKVLMVVQSQSQVIQKNQTEIVNLYSQIIQQS